MYNFPNTKKKKKTQQNSHFRIFEFENSFTLHTNFETRKFENWQINISETSGYFKYSILLMVYVHG